MTDYLTKAKFEQIQDELQDLKTNRRKEIADQLEYAKSLGDLSENAEYHEAREMQANLEGRITRLEELLKTAEIVEGSGTDTVNVSNEVDVQKVGSKTMQTFSIVGGEEADTAEGKISVDSPFGSSINGKTKGDVFEVVTPGGKVKYKIIDIR